MPKLNGLEHTAIVIAAAGLGARLVTLLGPVWWLALVGGLLVGGVSFGIRRGWKPSISP